MPSNSPLSSPWQPKNPPQVEAEAAPYSVLAIDEGQFFPDLADMCDRWASQGKSVIVAALDGTFQREPFPVIMALIPRAEEVIKLTAICVGCGADAAFSRRLSDETDVEVIGGADKYVAMCRACYAEPHPPSLAAKQAAARLTAAAPASTPAPMSNKPPALAKTHPNAAKPPAFKPKPKMDSAPAVVAAMPRPSDAAASLGNARGRDL